MSAERALKKLMKIRRGLLTVIASHRLPKKIKELLVEVVTDLEEVMSELEEE